METQALNVFIVDSNRVMAGSLRRYLENRFGKRIHVSLFFNGESCLNTIHDTTNLVIMEGDEQGGLDVLKTIKKRYPKTEVIMHTSNDDIAVAIEALHQGASGYIVKNNDSWDKIRSFVGETITQPFRVLVGELGIVKFIGVFLAVFAAMAGAVMIILKFTN